MVKPPHSRYPYAHPYTCTHMEVALRTHIHTQAYTHTYTCRSSLHLGRYILGRYILAVRTYERQQLATPTHILLRTYASLAHTRHTARRG
jgi:hypothetical protein